MSNGMNDLNSLIIEGSVKTELDVNLFGSSFILTNKRTLKDKDGFFKDCESDFIIFLDERLTKYYRERLPVGQIGKVIGQLNNNNGKTEIKAEHIELQNENGRY